MNFELESYMIRRKLLKIFGASFHVYDPGGRVIAFSSQKAFKLKEDIRVFEDESKRKEILSIQARQIIDFAAAYDIVDSVASRKVGAARRKGWSSLLRDAWELLDDQDRVVAKLQEDSTTLALLRRFLSKLIPQNFHLRGLDGEEHARFRVHFNPFIYKLSVTRVGGSKLDPRLVFGAAVLVSAIEGRQR